MINLVDLDKAKKSYMEVISRIRHSEDSTTLDFLAVWNGVTYFSQHEKVNRDEVGKLILLKNELIQRYALKEGIIYRELTAYNNELPKEWTRVVDKEWINSWRSQ